MRLLQERFGWQPYPQKHFESRFTRFYESYWLPKKFGYDTRRVQYSSLILTKQMTREEALEKLSRPAYDEATIAQESSSSRRSSASPSMSCSDTCDGPNKTYRDYRSQEEHLRARCEGHAPGRVWKWAASGDRDRPVRRRKRRRHCQYLQEARDRRHARHVCRRAERRGEDHSAGSGCLRLGDGTAQRFGNA